jgi:LAS superfamily LD-carboxypeptidase LdcB
MKKLKSTFIILMLSLSVFAVQATESEYERQHKKDTRHKKSFWYGLSHPFSHNTDDEIMTRRWEIKQAAKKRQKRKDAIIRQIVKKRGIDKQVDKILAERKSKKAAAKYDKKNEQQILRRRAEAEYAQRHTHSKYK